MTIISKEVIAKRQESLTTLQRIFLRQGTDYIIIIACTELL